MCGAQTETGTVYVKGPLFRETGARICGDCEQTLFTRCEICKRSREQLANAETSPSEPIPGGREFLQLVPHADQGPWLVVCEACRDNEAWCEMCHRAFAGTNAIHGIVWTEEDGETLAFCEDCETAAEAAVAAKETGNADRCAFCFEGVELSRLEDVLGNGVLVCEPCRSDPNFLRRSFNRVVRDSWVSDVTVFNYLMEVVKRDPDAKDNTWSVEDDADSAAAFG